MPDTENDRPKPDTIDALFDAVYGSFAMLAGMELDLFSTLQGVSRTASEIADILALSEVKLRPLLYALVVCGLLTVEDGRFANTAEANHYMVRGKPTYLGGTHALVSSNWARMLRTAETVRAGRPMHQQDYHQTSLTELERIFRGLEPGAVADAGQLMKHHDYSACRTVLDVGGGSGAVAIALARANPHLSATVVELPSVAPVARKRIAESDLSGRVQVVAANLVKDKLDAVYDTAVARHVLQVLSASDNRALLKNLASALKPDGILHLIGWILDDSRLTPRSIVERNLVLLNAYEDGQAYTEREYREWLDEAGFAVLRRTVMADGSSILTARRGARS